MVVSKSSVEVELRSTTLGMCETLWLMMLQEELVVKVLPLMVIHRDNKVAISTSHNLVHYDHTKHLRWIGNSLRKIDGVIKVSYVPTTQQTTNILRKALYKPMLKKLVDKCWWVLCL